MMTVICSTLSNANGIKNQHRLIMCVWLNSFPNINYEGNLQHQLSIDRLRPENEEVNKQISRDINTAILYGFIPKSQARPDIKLEQINTL